MEYTLIANTGIQLFTIPLRISMTEKFRLWFHEWYDTSQGQWLLEPVQAINFDGTTAYYNKNQLKQKGYLKENMNELTMQYLHDDGLDPLRIDDEMCDGVKGEIFSFAFTDKNCKLGVYEEHWLPLPYFFCRTPKRLQFGSFNWARAKFHFKREEKGYREYDVILAFDTKVMYDEDDYRETPVFRDRFQTEMDFRLCDDEFMVMDFCTHDKNWSYINDYLFATVHPNIERVGMLKGKSTRKMAYMATYNLLINYLAHHHAMPDVKLYKDHDVETQNVDMVVDIGNSKTTALLIENSENFNQVRMLALQDYTQTTTTIAEQTQLNRHCEPFDMRVAFRKADFGQFGITDSKQFVYPSLVRLGTEANTLIHRATRQYDGQETLSTYSSPKRYLWDTKPSKEEWRYMVLPGEQQENILQLKGISQYIKSDGRIDPDGNGGTSFHYSRCSLMTFSFLEMIVQAMTQINSYEYRCEKTGLGRQNVPRKIRRIIVTCPTAMSGIERKNLTQCAKDSVVLYNKFYHIDEKDDPLMNIEVVPNYEHGNDDATDNTWYYDEATCSQLVYMYGEAGQKYKGYSSEFFELYGKTDEGDSQPSLTLASIDIGAGTSDLMISKYSYTKEDVTTISPDPLFYDSYYFAGDDMLKAMVKNIMLFDYDGSALWQQRGEGDAREFRQRLKNFFGPDYSGQTLADRIVRKEFNVQYSVPLMHHYLDLLSKDSADCTVKYEDVFADCPPNQDVIDGFRERTGIDVTTLEWEFRKTQVEDVISHEFEPLLKKVATIMHAYAADIILLSGRPASLKVIRSLFLKYYSVSPDRLIVLNNYYVGDWYPFGNNTGYIANPKTIVAMGGVIAYYATELSSLNRFVIDMEPLRKHLKSTINYIEPQSLGGGRYLMTPDKHAGELTVSTLPEILNIRQIGIDTYPYRPLYRIDFNRQQMTQSMKRLYEKKYDEMLTDAKAYALVDNKIDELKKRMPYKVSIERDSSDKESLSIVGITDKDGNELTDSCLEIHIQSLGIDEKYWLDSGAFEF